MAQVELDLLERPLDQEGRIGVEDGSESFQRQAGAGADLRLLPDADVDDAIGVASRGDTERRNADVGEHDCSPVVLLEQG